jgi:hypothetical protein
MGTLPAMIELGPVAWPLPPIRTERFVLREPEARDRAAFIELPPMPPSVSGARLV